jgi:hypothetical protein
MNNPPPDDLLTGLEGPAIRKELIPSWMKTLLLVLIFYKTYSLLRSFQFLLLTYKLNHLAAEKQLLSWAFYVGLEVLEALVYIALLRQWKQAVTGGIIVLSVSLCSLVVYFLNFLMGEHTIFSALMIEVLITLFSGGILVIILVKLFRIRREWENGVAGK